MMDANPPDDQSGQTAQGSQTNIGKDVNGPVLSGEFHGPVNVGDIKVGDVHGIAAIGPGAVVNVIYQGRPIEIPGLGAIAQHRTALRAKLAADALERWGGMGAYIQEEGATLPIEASPYQAGAVGPRQNLLELMRHANRLLILGEPGSGKTVALQRLAWELCTPTETALPVLIELFKYAGAPLADVVLAGLRELNCLKLAPDALDAFLQAAETPRCVFLFDGLNEVPPAHRDRLLEQLTLWMQNYPRHSAIVTSRSQDQLWRRARDEMEQTVLVQPIHDEQARVYLVARLPEHGAALYDGLNERLRILARTPFLLWLIKESGQQGAVELASRADLYQKFVARLLARRDWFTHLDADGATPPEATPRVLQAALTHLAYHLGQKQVRTCDRAEAIQAVTPQINLEQAPRVIAYCARAGLLTGDDALWFAPHQTLQEHFAARALAEIAQKEQHQNPLQRAWKTARHIAGRDDGLLALAAQDWWMETFVQLAGMVADPDWLALEVARVNPWLAWWCVAEGQAVDKKTRQRIEQRSNGLLRSPRVADRRRAVQTLAQINNERIISALWAALCDEIDADVAQLIVSTLAEHSDAVRPLIDRALQNADTKSKRALENILGQSLAWIPPGPFKMGSDTQKYSQAHSDELPQHEVTLSGYWIGRYPVTVAQFRAFVARSGYKPDERSLEDPDTHPVRYVNWNDALAYCQWLSQTTGLTVTLPSEAEWEKAARGTDGRLWPWGDEPPDATRCNFNDNVKSTTPVGQYSPRGDSPYGCADMAGNVWEWTHSLYKPYPYEPTDGREELQSTDSWVVRGGSWSSLAVFARAAYRNGGSPGSRYYYIGFRVCVRPPSL